MLLSMIGQLFKLSQVPCQSQIMRIFHVHPGLPVQTHAITVVPEITQRLISRYASTHSDTLLFVHHRLGGWSAS